MKKTQTKKRAGFGLQLTTKKGSKGNYLFIKTSQGAYHAFLEVSTKSAAKDCGAKPKKTDNTRTLCKKLLRF